MTAHPPAPGGILFQLGKRCSYRLRQGLAFGRRQLPPTIPPEIALRLLPGTIGQFRALTSADQRHLLAVSLQLRAQGAPNDLWFAGLLHDIGKAHEGHRVRLIDRAAWVLVSGVKPIERLVRRGASMPRFGRGIWIAAHHAELGRAMLRELGYNDRICTLVAFHDDEARARFDPELARLQAADDAPYSVPGRGRKTLESLEAIRGRAG